MIILILGANGFIGSHLCKTILKKTNWDVVGMDLAQDKINFLSKETRFHFFLGDMTQQKKWIKEKIKQCDVVIPLAGIATPSMYIQNPLRIFELDFEANLEIIRHCVHFKKRIIFPSTSEVYGMCEDDQFDEETSHLVTGPVHKERWIYAASKQLLDRVIYAYGKHHQLIYTLFRPFNWYGPHLDNIFNPKPGSSRVLSQFIGNIIRGEPVVLVNGGQQRRAFTYIDDGIDAILKIIDNKNQNASQRIFNIGNPYESISIRQLAEVLIQQMSYYPKWSETAKKVQLITMDEDIYYGIGYQDVSFRTPAITKAETLLGWKPTINLDQGIKKTLDFYFNASTNT